MNPLFLIICTLVKIPRIARPVKKRRFSSYLYDIADIQFFLYLFRIYINQNFRFIDLLF